ncbi:hypothetical protein B0T26DRAFT_262626 [Lasiosphaeria miniovina]|uniref:Uncharacterized protein n=1 Tax=Lasiosphaeria miniovina TaxID=1954250 RepID=A0AA40AWY8_9PEZI|nr:uncharacterized protein B0T26DRAFT_262626 [Lasiosphaeria miniovina]KAK0723534.1 hypothetical protein B0T26DRAFT_262626 [Lasiosphaeria miniovina]
MGVGQLLSRSQSAAGELPHPISSRHIPRAPCRPPCQSLRPASDQTGAGTSVIRASPKPGHVCQGILIRPGAANGTLLRDREDAICSASQQRLPTCRLCSRPRRQAAFNQRRSLRPAGRIYLMQAVDQASCTLPDIKSYCMSRARGCAPSQGGRLHGANPRSVIHCRPALRCVPHSLTSDGPATWPLAIRGRSRDLPMPHTDKACPAAPSPVCLYHNRADQTAHTTVLAQWLANHTFARHEHLRHPTAGLCMAYLNLNRRLDLARAVG